MRGLVAGLIGALLVVACGGSDSTDRVAPAATSTIATSTVAGPEPSPTSEPEDRRDERHEMVDRQIEGRGISDPLVLAAMRTVPRHRFVTDDFAHQAYDDHPLPIGHGQTISQPYIVALMSEFLGVSPGDRVLEIGTGSGYQAAILAEMGIEVYTIEIVPELAERGAGDLDAAGYEAVRARQGDGYLGWPDEAPFDAIIVTAAPDHVPQPLVQQLAPGASMVIPIGPVGAVQTLWRFTADDSGELLAESLGAVRFVPLTRTD